MDIELFPLEKVRIDQVEIYLGMKREQVTDLMGTPECVYEHHLAWGIWFPTQVFYHQSEIRFDFDNDNRLKFIEFLGGHKGELTPKIYGVSAFDVERDTLVKTLSDANCGRVDSHDGYVFLEIDVSLWAEEDDPDDDENYWDTIGMGVKGYFSSRNE